MLTFVILRKVIDTRAALNETDTLLQRYRKMQFFFSFYEAFPHTASNIKAKWIVSPRSTVFVLS